MNICQCAYKYGISDLKRRALLLTKYFCKFDSLATFHHRVLRRRVNFGDIFLFQKKKNYEAENTTYKTASKAVYFGLYVFLILHIETTTIRT